MADSDELLAVLNEPPDSDVEPPVDTAEQELPFKKLRWQDFEKLCVRLIRLEGTPEHAQRFGTEGQAQSGIDIYSRLPDGRYVVYQCKKYETLWPSDIKNAVEKFLEQDEQPPTTSEPQAADEQAPSWAARAFRFVLCTSETTVVTQRAETVE